jgi:hypothetical protein
MALQRRSEGKAAALAWLSRSRGQRRFNDPLPGGVKGLRKQVSRVVVVRQLMRDRDQVESA